MHHMTTVFMGGAHPGQPVGAVSDAVSSTTSLSDVLKRALLNTGQSNATLRSVRSAPSIAAAADFCGTAPDAFINVLSRWVDTSSIGSFLLVHVGCDVATSADLVAESRDAACMASFTPRRVQLVCKVAVQSTPRKPQRASSTQTRSVRQSDVASVTDPAWRDSIREELREEVRNEVLAELVPMLERSTLAAEAALEECKRLLVYRRSANDATGKHSQSCTHLQRQ